MYYVLSFETGNYFFFIIFHAIIIVKINDELEIKFKIFYIYS